MIVSLYVTNFSNILFYLYGILLRVYRQQKMMNPLHHEICLVYILLLSSDRFVKMIDTILILYISQNIRISYDHLYGNKYHMIQEYLLAKLSSYETGNY